MIIRVKFPYLISSRIKKGKASVYLKARMDGPTLLDGVDRENHPSLCLPRKGKGRLSSDQRQVGFPTTIIFPKVFIFIKH